MSAKAEVLRAPELLRAPAGAGPRVERRAGTEVVSEPTGWDATNFAREQIRGLARRLFLANGGPTVSQVVFCAADAETDVKGISLEVSKALALETRGQRRAGSGQLVFRQRGRGYSAPQRSREYFGGAKPGPGFTLARDGAADCGKPMVGFAGHKFRARGRSGSGISSSFPNVRTTPGLRLFDRLRTILRLLQRGSAAGAPRRRSRTDTRSAQNETGHRAKDKGNDGSFRSSAAWNRTQRPNFPNSRTNLSMALGSQIRSKHVFSRIRSSIRLAAA
jgi:hypothetical protein